MGDDVFTESINGLGRREYGIESTGVALGLFNTDLVSLISKFRVEPVESVKCTFVESECNDAAFVEHGLCRLVFNRLRHVIDVDVITEDLTRVLIIGGDRRTCEADVRGVG